MRAGILHMDFVGSGLGAAVGCATDVFPGTSNQRVLIGSRMELLAKELIYGSNATTLRNVCGRTAVHGGCHGGLPEFRSSRTS